MSKQQYLNKLNIRPISIPERKERVYTETQVLQLLDPFFDEQRLKTFVEFCNGFPGENPVTLLEELVCEEDE
jgi:hypothetical protein